MRKKHKANLRAQNRGRDYREMRGGCKLAILK